MLIRANYSFCTSKAKGVCVSTERIIALGIICCVNQSLQSGWLFPFLTGCVTQAASYQPSNGYRNPPEYQ